MGDYPGGYGGKILRIDLTKQKVSEEALDEVTLRECIGGTGLGAKYLLEEVPPNVQWDSPENKIMVMVGPLSGAPVPGAGMFSITVKGCMTDLAGTSQAVGFFGAYLSSNGFDGMIIQGSSTDWVYLFIKDGKLEIKDASHLLGKDTYETEEAIQKEVGNFKVSTHAIGIAGENKVRFAALVGDKGHVCAHNGIGAVFGSKKVKAIAAVRSNLKSQLFDKKTVTEISKKMIEQTMASGRAKWGTSQGVANTYKLGQLPIKNYTTSIWPHYEKFTGQYIRANFKHKPKPCWACSAHCAMMEITEGPYAGLVTEEPEYEGFAELGPQVGNADPATAIMLNDLVDRLGIDVNETGWVLGWVMECYEKGILNKNDLDGIELTWGNAEAMVALLNKIAKREGVGDLLAEGVKRNSERVGGGAENLGVYTMKGASPRGHDHRGRWEELLDTCLSNTSTLEASGGVPVKQHGLEPVKNRFSPEEISTMNAKVNGRTMFADCVPICRFTAEDIQKLIDVLNATTGWDLTLDEIMQIGRRAINRLRVFNILHGITPEKEMPSPRYGSAPIDGPAQGFRILDVFEKMRENYWTLMGWDSERGWPLPETLEELGLKELIPYVWDVSKK